VVGNCRIFRQAIALIAFLAVGSVASAAVTARVDRPTVDLNESFTLEVEIDDATDLEPDFSVLEESFYVGQVSKLSNTSIFNGEIRRSLTWSVALMPKTTGMQQIPPIPLGNVQSNPVTISVNEPTNAPPGEADVFVTSEVDVDETYVQAQILYRIRIYRAVATRQPALREPSISGVETLVELAGDERQYESVLNGRAYNVIERVIALFPQESGEIRISPARFEARVLRDGRITGRKVFQSDPHTVNVLPIPAPPADHPDAAWLPARDVQLTESWSRPPDEMEAGEPVTRIIRLEALGQIETQLPTLDAPEVDGLNAYSDQPDLRREIDSGGIRGIREDQYAIIGLTGGEIELPAIEVPWWDLDDGEWKVASLPARTLSIKGAALPPQPVEPPVTEPGPSTVEELPAGPTEEETVAVVTFWQRAAELLGVLWLLTLAAWWWSSRARPRRERAPREPRQKPAHQQQAQLLKQARKAAVQSDAAELRQLLLDWSRLQWPDDAPRSLGELAHRVEDPLADELRRLSAVSYGRGDRAWEGSGLANALQSVTFRDDATASRSRDPLPPLMPPAA
jgi:hypothetical protein